jgi:pilus assembly protein CpaC
VRGAAAVLIALATVGRSAAQAPAPADAPGPAAAPVIALPALPPAVPEPDDVSEPVGPPPLPVTPPAPASGPNSVRSFIEGFKQENDAAFEVVVGQGRILTIREDITVGRNQPLIAVGDPTTIAFAVLNPRQLRITGLRIGVTDLSITTATGRTFSFEVRVIRDLTPLTVRLREVFPDASLRLTQLREDIIVEGQARDTQQVENILETIQEYLRLIAAASERQVRAQTLPPNQGPLIQGPPDQGGAPNAQPPAPPAPPAPGGGVVAPPPPGVGVAEPKPPAAGGDGIRKMSLTSEAAQEPFGGGMGFPTAMQALPPFGGGLLSRGGYLVGPQSQIDITGQLVAGRIINLIRVPGSQQVLLKVRIAELNRSAIRSIGSNFLGIDRRTGAIIGTQIASPVTAIGEAGFVTPPNIVPGRKLGGAVASQAQALAPPNGTTVFGIFQDANFEFMLNALRQNSMLKILAEPNLVALSGHQASFLAGGEFPVPVPQVSASGVAPTITVRFKEFGVRLNFVPSILDGDIVRLAVAPEVSQIDFTIATTLVAGGTPVPGLNTRKAQTTVELRQGQTLAIAGLIQLQLTGSTTRIPIMGDLPVIGPFFSNTNGQRQEKELVVLVTPYLVEPMNRDQVPPTPGDEVKEPNDLEFYILNRIEGRTGRDFRSTTKWDDPMGLVPLLKLERKYVHGPSGFSD